ncbi:hypothetical protein VTH82DRAFT_2513 [Thermothelomyces myriococcoides]
MQTIPSFPVLLPSSTCEGLMPVETGPTVAFWPLSVCDLSGAGRVLYEIKRFDGKDSKGEEARVGKGADDDGDDLFMKQTNHTTKLRIKTRAIGEDLMG